MLIAAITIAGVGKVLVFLAMLSILITLHEYGHFLVARRNGVRVNEFAIGMGPKLFGWTSPKSGTLYSLRALPIGGYCAMQGEDNKTNEAEQQREFRSSTELEDDNFQAKSPWQRLAIVIAGPAANFVLCYAILLVGAVAFGVASTKSQPVVATLIPGSPAARAGLRVGDKIVSIDGVPVAGGDVLVKTIHESKGKQLSISFSRDGQVTTENITPTPCPAPNPPGQWCIGFLPVPAYERVGFGEAVVDSGYNFVAIADGTVEGIRLLVTHFSKYAAQTSGPIGMGQAATTIQDWGWGPYFRFAAMISFALGLFNLLPIPALDGGRAAFIIAELIRGKPVDPEREAMVHFAGFAALMALILIVAFHDILRITSGNGVL